MDETFLTFCYWGVVFGLVLTPATDFNRCLVSLRPLSFVRFGCKSAIRWDWRNSRMLNLLFFGGKG